MNETKLEDKDINEQKDLSPVQEKVTPKGIRNIQGVEPAVSPPPTSSDTPPDPDLQEDQSISGSQQERTYVPLSPYTKMELNQIKNLPVGERKEAMGKFFNDQKSILGNQTSEGKNMQYDATILPHGKGVLIHDENGEEYQIDYE